MGVPRLRTYFVETWGCQMNVLDSQILEGQLQARGLEAAATAEGADVALLNTCSVREKAVHKVLSRLGELREAKHKGGLPRIVGVCGCVAEQEGSEMLGRSSVVDFVLGPGRIAELGQVLDAVVSGQRATATGFAASRDIDAHLVARGDRARQFVTVVHGCNQHCTFCVVPYTRGHERSRPLADVVAEARHLAAVGVKEVTLLGQTVNAYRCPATGAGFAELLEEVCAIAGPWRIQFLTSHPKYFTDKMIRTLSELPRLGRYLHIPVQSGSTAVLKRMHRGYTREEYLDLIARLRAALPETTLSTDVIVGFPGESDEQFAETLALAAEVRFAQLFAFAFSPRPRTPAARYGDRVSRTDAKSRLAELFALQAAIRIDLNRARIGRVVEVLVDGPAKRGERLWQGRGDDNRVVNFSHDGPVAPGDLVAVRVTGATAHSLLGRATDTSSGA